MARSGLNPLARADEAAGGSATAAACDLHAPACLAATTSGSAPPPLRGRLQRQRSVDNEFRQARGKPAGAAWSLSPLGEPLGMPLRRGMPHCRSMPSLSGIPENTTVASAALLQDSARSKSLPALQGPLSRAARKLVDTGAALDGDGRSGDALSPWASRAAAGRSPYGARVRQSTPRSPNVLLAPLDGSPGFPAEGGAPARGTRLRPAGGARLVAGRSSLVPPIRRKGRHSRAHSDPVRSLGLIEEEEAPPPADALKADPPASKLAQRRARLCRQRSGSDPPALARSKSAIPAIMLPDSQDLSEGPR